MQIIIEIEQHLLFFIDFYVCQNIASDLYTLFQNRKYFPFDNNTSDGLKCLLIAKAKKSKALILFFHFIRISHCQICDLLTDCVLSWNRNPCVITCLDRENLIKNAVSFYINLHISILKICSNTLKASFINNNNCHCLKKK